MIAYKYVFTFQVKRSCHKMASQQQNQQNQQKQQKQQKHSKQEDLWYYDPVNFITPHTFLKIVPLPDGTLTSQLNALMRFSIYYSIVLMVVKQDTQPIFFMIFIAFFTFGIYYYNKAEQYKEKMSMVEQNIEIDKVSKQTCVKPTRNNPFMNVTYNDYKENAVRPKACDITQSRIKKKVEALYEDTNVFDSDDIFKRNSTSRQFYTNPITTIPNDQASFANWLYKTPGKTCKEGPEANCKVSYRTMNE